MSRGAPKHEAKEKSYRICVEKLQNNICVACVFCLLIIHCGLSDKSVFQHAGAPPCVRFRSVAVIKVP